MPTISPANPLPRLAFWLLLLVASCADPANDPATELAVRTAWSEFKDAALAGDGERAASHVTSATHADYAAVRDLALHASRAELNALPLGRRYMILSTRFRLPADELAAMSGRDLFAHGINAGWIAKDNPVSSAISAIEFDGDHARAQMTVDGAPTEQFLYFIEEGGVWRFDMLQLMSTLDLVFDSMWRESDLSEAEFIKRLIGAVTGKSVTDALWEAPAADPR